MLVGLAVVVLLLALAVPVWLATRGRPRRLDEVDRWFIARQITTGWAEHPDSAPAPVRDMADRDAAAAPD